MTGSDRGTKFRIINVATHVAKKITVLLALLPVTDFARAQTEGRMTVDAGKCRVVVPDNPYNRGTVKRDWSGSCINGLATGPGIYREYRHYNGQTILTFISRQERQQGLPDSTKPFEAYLSYPEVGKFEIRWRNTPGKPTATGQQEIQSGEIENWAREIVENNPGQPIRMGENPPGKGGSTAGSQTGSGDSSGAATTGAPGGGNSDINGGTRRDGAMTYSTGVYFFRTSYQGKFMNFTPAQAGSESEALALLQRGSSFEYKYDGGCPAGSKAAGPYWGRASFTSVTGGGTGHAWACGFASEVEAGNAVIDYCIRTSCAKSDQYMTLAIGNVLKQPQPLDQYLCADGNPGTRVGSLGPRTGQGRRSRRDAGGTFQQELGEDEPCITFVRRWMR